jgi:integrase
LNKPWYRKGRGWYVTLDGQQVPLGKDKDQAFESWHKICASEKRRDEKNPTFRECCQDYVLFAVRQINNGELKSRTLDDYVWYIDQFNELHGETQVDQLEPQHLTDWLNSKPTWGPSAQRGAITALQRVLSWAKRERRIAANHLEGYRKPPQSRRCKLVETDEHAQMIEEVRGGGSASRHDKQFQLVLVAIKHTGGRPQDVSRARVEFVDSSVTHWNLPEHKRSRHTMQPKIVYLSPCLRTVTKMLMAGRTEGPLFRGRLGQLTVNAIGCRIKRLKKKLGLDPELIAYSYRHTYITDSLSRGVDAATVAELVGTSIQMIERHYGHLSKRSGHLQESAAKAMGRKPDSTAPKTD